MEKLGVNPTLIVAQIISFVLLFVVLNKFLYPKIREALQKRHQAIKDTFEGQQEIEKRLKEFSQQQAQDRETASQEMKALLHEARQEAEQAKKTIIDESKELAKKEREQVQKQIDQDKIVARQDLEKYAKDIAKNIVEEMLADKSKDQQWQKDQIATSLKALKKMHE